MYTLGSVALPVGLGSCSASWAVAPGGFLRPWVRGAGFSVSPRLRGSGFSFSGGGLSGWAAAVVASCAVAPCPCAAGWCGVFRGVHRLAHVGLLVSVPCFGVVVCFGAPWCVVPCFAVLRRAGPCCVMVRPALSCRVAPCRAAVCGAVPLRAAPCSGVPGPGVPCRGALHGGALWCAVPCCFVFCRGGGVGWGVWWLDWPVSLWGTRVEVLWLAGGWRVRLGLGWLAGSVLRGSRCAARAGGSGRCPGVALPGGLCLGPVSSWGPCL